MQPQAAAMGTQAAAMGTCHTSDGHTRNLVVVVGRVLFVVQV
jgi:hypothetical protein